jgi:hypothetical protein
LPQALAWPESGFDLQRINRLTASERRAVIREGEAQIRSRANLGNILPEFAGIHPAAMT